MEGSTLKGYYSFWQYDKIDKKNNAYFLRLMDDNLNEVKTIEIVRPKNTILLETAFNSSCFMFVFISKDDVELVTYDKTGTLLGSKVINDISKWERMRLTQIMTDGEANASVFPVGKDGFIRATFMKNDKLGYAIESYGNDCGVKWTSGSDPKSDLLETAEIVSASDKYIITNVGRKKSLMSKDANMFVVVHSAVDGKKVFESALEDGENEMSTINSYYDETAGEITILGEYSRKVITSLKQKVSECTLLNMTLQERFSNVIKWTGRKTLQNSPSQEEA
jgi:hypothetical protein